MQSIAQDSSIEDMSKKILKIHPDDNVLVVLSDLKAGEPVTNGLAAVHDVPAKHKVVIRDLQPGEEIKMYGITVGKAVTPIAAGVHASCAGSCVSAMAGPYQASGPFSAGWPRPA